MPAKYQDLTFSKLFGYYGSKGIVLNEKTFVKNLGLKNEKGEYNMIRNRSTPGDREFKDGDEL